MSLAEMEKKLILAVLRYTPATVLTQLRFSELVAKDFAQKCRSSGCRLPLINSH